MKNLCFTPLSLTLAGVLIISQTAFAEALAAQQPNLHEEIITTPGRSITPADESLLSASAGKVLHHVALARDALRKKEAERAKQELKQAEALLDIIQSMLPTTFVQDRIWTADNKLQYENKTEVALSRVPISASLDERIEVGQVKLAKAKGDPASKEHANDEAEVESAILYFEEVDLPLNAIRHFVASALVNLGQNRISAADQALRSAQDSVDFIAISVPTPLLAARVNLERAHAHFSAGNAADAKADVNRAIEQLNAEERQVAPETKADVQKLLADAKLLQTRLDQGGPTLGNEMNSLWHRTRALAERAKEFTAFGWAKLRTNGALRGDLIEAKRFVSYADIDANVANNPAQARLDLQQANDWLSKAATDAKGKADAEVYTKDARAVIDSMLAGQAKLDAGDLGNLKSQLGQAIGKL